MKTPEEYMTDAEQIMEAIKQYWNAVESGFITDKATSVEIYGKFKGFDERDLIRLTVDPQKGNFVVRFRSHGSPIFLLDIGEVVFQSRELARQCAELYEKYTHTRADVMEIH